MEMIDNGKKLSIVIPYYKTYELTYKLMEVLVPQITDDVEVFLVDDGCNEERLDIYKDKVNVIHCEKNGGMSVALNTGIKKATGKYIGFVDSDDLVTENYIEELINAINNHDEDLIYMDWKDMHSGDIIHHPDNYAQKESG